MTTKARNTKTPARARSAATQKAIALLSNLVGRSNLIAKMAGRQFGGNRDIYTVAGYVPQGQIKYEHYWGAYSRDGIAGRMVDMPAKTTWRTPPKIVEGTKDEPKTDTAFTKAFDEMSKRLRLWSYMNRVDRLAGVGRYAVMMLGVRNSTDQQLKTPLVSVAGPEDIVYLGVFSENNAHIEEWETDTGNARFGLPRLYKLRLSSNQQSFKNADLLVHASRVLHVAEDRLEDDTFGRPRLERSLNRLFDLDKVAASTGESYWQLAIRILQAKIDKDGEVTDPQLKELDEKLVEMVHDLRRQFSGQGVELSWLGSDTPNVSQVADFYFSLLAASCGIPKRILFGSEMGELASTTDQANYLGQINERQEQFAEPDILRAFIDRMIAIKALPTPAGEYQILWPTLFEETDKDKAAANLSRAQTAQALTPVGGNPLLLVDIDDEGTVKLTARQHDDELPEEMLPEPAPAPGPVGEDVDGAPGAGAEDDEEEPPAAGAPPAGGPGDGGTAP